ncbi:hypothetical protein B0H10DRAFT_1951679 [Mycena sp. CBHHK59/15]|nr:hypothetical protein B0H10DRAFT_1951679 [Mycena sp. CBHHK59/15]
MTPTAVQQEKMIAERLASWLWTELGRMGKLSESEMEDWSSKANEISGDRVKWFRAEVDMQHWQEHGEQKLVELLRTIRSFSKMQKVWTELADSCDVKHPGHAAYAGQKAVMYQRQTDEVTQFIVAAGYQPLLEARARVIDFIIGEWAKEAAFLSGQVVACV